MSFKNQLKNFGFLLYFRFVRQGIFTLMLILGEVFWFFLVYSHLPVNVDPSANATMLLDLPFADTLGI